MQFASLALPANTGGQSASGFAKRPWPVGATMRSLGLFLAVAILSGAAYVELLLLVPSAWYTYSAVVVLVIAWAVRREPLRRQSRRLALASALAIVAVTLYVVPWSTRKPFLRDLSSIRPGMTADQVRKQMSSYIAVAEQRHSGALSRLSYRHSDHWRFNADFGNIYIVSGRVAQVEFSAD